MIKNKNKKKTNNSQLPRLSNVGQVFQDVYSLAAVQLRRGCVVSAESLRLGMGFCSWGQTHSLSVPETTIKMHTFASNCSYCYFEAHQPNILETKGTHTASQESSVHSGNAHQRGLVGSSCILREWKSFHLKTSDTFINVELCVCCMKCAAMPLWRNE